LGELKIPKVTKISRVVRPPLIDCDLAVGFFDGASQDRGDKCGARAVLKCPVKGTYRLKMNYGRGSNTRGELLALWCILHFAYYKNVTMLWYRPPTSASARSTDLLDQGSFFNLSS
jgi:hypothetical protein